MAIDFLLSENQNNDLTNLKIAADFQLSENQNNGLESLERLPIFKFLKTRTMI